MDLDNKPENTDNESWLDDILTSPDLNDELGPDESAVNSAGLTHPDDAELERIIAEAVKSDWDSSTQIVDLGQSGAQAPQESDYSDAPQPAPAEDSSDPDDWIYHIPIDDIEGDIPSAEAEPESDAADNDSPIDGAQSDSPVHKGRPRRKKGYGLLGIPHILSTVIWLVIAVAIGTALGRMAWLCASDVLAFGREDQIVKFTVTQDDTIDSIAQKLQQAGLIRYPKLFKWYVDISDSGLEIDPGTYDLNTLYDYNALVGNMSKAALKHNIVEITFLEGYTCAQIFASLEENGVCTVSALEEYCANGELGDYWFLEGAPRGSKYCLEGFLFPDTYEFYTNDEPKRVIEKFLDNFDVRTTAETDKYGECLRDKLDTLNERLASMYASNGYDQEYIDAHRMSFRDVVIVASMIEKESGSRDENADVSSVIYNRLTNPANYPYLNIDATIVYALGGKEELTSADLQIDSPYNTYTRPGLTPGAISNPGKYSIRAALIPNDTDYYYYVLIPGTRSHKFFTNASDFDEYVESIRNNT